MKKKRIIRAAVVLLILIITSIFVYVGYLCYHTFGSIPLICPIKYFTGWYCPGCGMTRACLAAMRGNFYQAFRYNPLMVIVFPILVIYYIIVIVQWILYGRETISRRVPFKMVFNVLVIVMVYGVVRNIDIYPFILLAPTTL